MSVVVTSRSSASAPLHQLPAIDRFVEVCGFSKEHIVEYIQSEFARDQEKAGRLLEQLEDNPLVESVCSVPLNCAIVCHLWHTLEEALPTTITEIYTKIILNLVFRNIQKIDTCNTVMCLSKFDSLPADLQQSWWLMCEFACQALEKDQLVFSQEELEAFFPEGLALDKRILCFGLLQSAESVLETGFGKSFHFLHLTFQEYLAALHLARQPPDKQLEVFQSHKQKDVNRFSIVNKFFFGINHFCDSNIDKCFFIQQIFKCVDSSFCSDTLALCHCAFEAHNDLVTSLMIRYIFDTHSPIGSSVKIGFGHPHTAHDCTAVLYVIANTQEHCDMEINFGNCGVRESQIKKLVDILVSKEGKLQITRLDLSGSRLTVSCLQALENAVRGDLFAKLMELDLAGSLTSDADTNAAWLTTFLEAHCPHLRSLNLSDNNLGVPGASAISKIFEQIDHRYSIILCLYKTNLGDEGLTILIRSLKVMSILALADNDIHATGVSCLADAVCEGKMVVVGLPRLSEFDLSNNPLGLEGTVAIGRMLSSSHCQLHSVLLSRCELTTAGGSLLNTDSGNTISGEAIRDVGQQLCQMPQSSSITWLELDGNSFTGEGIHILAGFMHSCPCLVSLYTSDCGITSDDLIWLLDKLTQLKSSSPNLCSKLESWVLHNNQIDDSGVSALMDHLPSLFPCLGLGPISDIDLDSNPVSSEMVKRVEEEMRRRLQESRSTSESSFQSHSESSFQSHSESSSQSHSESFSESSFDDLFEEQEEPLPSLRALPSTVSDQLTGRTLSPESASGDNIESVAGTSTLLPSPPPSFSSATLSLSDAVQCAEQPVDNQLQQGSCSDTVSGDSLDLQPPSSKRHKQDLTPVHQHRIVSSAAMVTEEVEQEPKKTAGEDEQGGKEDPSLMDIASGEGEETSPAPTTAALTAKTDSPRKKNPARETKKEGKRKRKKCGKKTVDEDDEQGEKGGHQVR